MNQLKHLTIKKFINQYQNEQLFGDLTYSAIIIIDFKL